MSNDDVKDSSSVRLFRAKVEVAMQRVKSIEQFRGSDTMVDYVFKVGRELFDTPLDQQDVAKLIRTGGRLTGVYVYLGQRSAHARAERDVYEQKKDEVEKEMLLVQLNSGTKVTEARAKVAGDVADLSQFVIEKDVAKNQWENITDAVEKMVSFIQSAIKVKEGERFQSSHALADNQR